MNNFKKLALAASIGSLMFGASAAQAHVSYNMTPGSPALGDFQNSANSSSTSNISTWTQGAPTDLSSNGYVGSLPANWVANVHNSTNPVTSMLVSDEHAISKGAPGTFNLATENNKWNPASSWGMVLDYGLIKMEAAGNLTITVSADDSSNFTPGFTLWNGWDTSSSSNVHQAWNGSTTPFLTGLGTSPSNPYNLGSSLSYLANASTTTATGFATLTLSNLSAGLYTIFIGGNASGATTGIDQSYKVNLSTTAVPVPAAAWLFGGALMSLFGANRRKKVLPA